VRQNLSNSETYAPHNIVIPTAGEILDDGTIIELVENPSQPRALALLKFDGREPEIGPQIEHEGRLYVPLSISSSVRRALRVPSGCAPSEPTTQLFARLVAVLENFTDLAEHARKSVATFLLADWVPELIPVPLTLFLWAPDPAAGARVLTVMGSLCRLALPVSGAVARDFMALPDDLPATLLLFRPPFSRRSRESLGAMGWRGLWIFRRGRLVQAIGAKAIASDSPLPEDTTLGPTIVVHVAATWRPLPFLDKKILESLAREFLPRLLRYRLDRCTAVVGESDHTYPAGPRGSLVTALEACFRDAPALKEAVLPLIEAAQNGHDPARADPRVPLLEVLRARCHEAKRDRLYVREITLDLNAKIIAGGGQLELTDRMVGSLLRSLGLATRKLDRHGRGLALDAPTRLRVHRLAHEHNVPSAEQAFPGCAECAHSQPPET
jgi:hypothetical protein